MFPAAHPRLFHVQGVDIHALDRYPDTTCADTAGDLLVFPVFQKDDEADLKPLLKATRGLAGRRAGPGRRHRKAGFTGQGRSPAAGALPAVKAGWILLAGLGKAEELGLETLRKVAGLAAKRARTMKADRVLVQLPAAGALGFRRPDLRPLLGRGRRNGPVAHRRTQDRTRKKPGCPEPWKFLADAKRATALREGVTEAEAYRRRLPLCPRPGQPAAEHPDARRTWPPGPAAWPGPRA